MPSAKLGGLASANADFKTMFVGATSAVCSGDGRPSHAFGFSTASVLPCGDTTLQGPSLVN